MTKALNHTAEAYDSLRKAYDFFNRKLFDAKLPTCLITFQRKSKSCGYFSSKRFGVSGTETVTDEIALNPMNNRSIEMLLSTLVHEMCHLWQFHLGTPPRKAYHDRQWANKMKEVGLYPSSTGAPGGKETGQKMSDYVIDGGVFQQACVELQFKKLYIDIGLPDEKKPANSKTKFTCVGCEANCWGKPDLQVICADCELLMTVAS